MKISSSTLSLQSSRFQLETHSMQESMRIRTSQPAQSVSQPVTLSAATQPNSAAGASPDGDGAINPKLQLLITLLERLTGYKFRVFTGSAQATSTPAASGSASAPVAQSGYSGQYSRVESYSLTEQTSFQASGTIKTSDGQEISFNLSLSMQYQYSETSATSIQFGDPVRTKDPLVINFAGTAAQLSNQRFAFDLDSDGTAEQISAPLSGSGFLALDLNGNGSVDDGSELFGASSGNGFGDLAQYDSDGNGWIDGNDSVFDKLKVWTPDVSGGGALSSLSDLGIGAISLSAVSTPFSIRNAANQVLGSVRASGVVLNEDGSVGSVQQIDLAV